MGEAEFDVIEARVLGLAPWQGFAWALGMSERLYPNYVLFSELCSFGDPKLLRNALDAGWDSLLSPDAKVDFSKQIEKLESVVPDPAAFDSFGVKPALDAAMAVMSAMELAAGMAAEGECLEAGRLSRATVEAYIDAAELNDVAEETLWRDEQEFETALLEQLEALHKPERDGLRAIRRFARNEGVSNIGITLE